MLVDRLADGVTLLERIAQQNAFGRRWMRENPVVQKTLTVGHVKECMAIDGPFTCHDFIANTLKSQTICEKVSLFC